ncbi:MAG: hypothetical protein LBJ31_02250 [Treponema sp.]|jgi:hypothetical protein|nr:hypothetical protein [Treponema sp.]
MDRSLTTDRPLLERLLKYSARALAAAAAFIFAWYVFGSYRRSDSEQLTLVRYLLTTGVALGIVSFYGLILKLVYLVRKKNSRFIRGALVYLALLVLAAAVSLFTGFIISAVGGNR